MCHHAVFVYYHLNKDFQSNPPDTIETAIADGIFILDLSTSQDMFSSIQKGLVKSLNLTIICADLYFNIYKSTSIKEVKEV